MMDTRTQVRIALALAILLIGYALQYNDGVYAARALVLLLAGTACAAFALVWNGLSVLWRRPTLPVAPPPPRGGLAGFIVPPLLGFAGVALVGLATNIVAMGLTWPGTFLDNPFPQDHPLLIGSMAVASAAIALMVWDQARARRVWFPTALIAAGTMGVWLIQESPDPMIDVMTVHRYAATALQGGNNPYAMHFPNIYDDSRFYAPGMTANGWVMFGFPYPPLSLLMSLPGQLWLGDFRYAELAALLVGASLIAFAPRARPSEANIAPLAASLLLFTPRSLFVLEMGWTESFAICWLGAAVYAACRAPCAFPWMLALLVSAKQHLVLALPFSLLLLRPFDLRAAVRMMWPALLVPLLFAMPFLVWNAAAFIKSVVILQLKEPFRADSLSVLSALQAAGYAPGEHHVFLMVMPLLALATAAGMTWLWADRSTTGFTAALGVCLLLLFLVSKKAFANYYYFVIAVLAAAAAASSHYADWNDGLEMEASQPATAVTV